VKPTFLFGGERQISQPRRVGLPPQFSLSSTISVDKGVVQDREKPIAKVGPGTKGRPALIGAHERIVHKVFGLGFVADERTCIAAQGRQLRHHVVDTFLWPRCAHDQYTEEPVI
jgi:hypothetical protein